MSRIATLMTTSIRRGTWKPADCPPFFHMARDIAHHARRRFDTTDLDKGLAHAIVAQMSGLPRITDEQRPLYQTALDIFEGCMPDDFGPVMKRAQEIRGLQGAILPDPTMIRTACDERMAADRAARIAEHGDPYEAIRSRMEEAAAAHPRLGLSFGYIGNMSTGPVGDDRSWMVFAKLATPRCLNACDVHFGGVHTDVIEDLAARMGEPFEAWLAKCEADLDAGRIRIVGPVPTAAMAA